MSERREIATLLEQWQSALRNVDQLRSLLEGMRNVDGISDDAIKHVRGLLEEAEKRESDLRSKVIGGVSGA